MLTVDEIKEKLIRTEKGKVKQILLEICRGKDGESILQIQMKIM